MKKANVGVGMELGEKEGEMGTFDFSVLDLDESMMVSLDDYSNLSLYRESSRSKVQEDDFKVSAADSAAAATAKPGKKKN